MTWKYDFLQDSEGDGNLNALDLQELHNLAGNLKDEDDDDGSGSDEANDVEDEQDHQSEDGEEEVVKIEPSKYIIKRVINLIIFKGALDDEEADSQGSGSIIEELDQFEIE